MTGKLSNVRQSNGLWSKKATFSMKRLSNDEGFAFGGALMLMVMLIMVSTILLGALTGQLGQSNQNRQFAEGRQGNNAALEDALNELNSAGYARPTVTLSGTTPGIPHLLPSDRKSGTADGAKWSWWFDADNNLVMIETTSGGKTRTEEVLLDSADVATYRLNASDGNKTVYSMSALGAWRDALSFKADPATGSSTINGTVNGSIGLYGNARLENSAAIEGTKLVTVHDDRAKGTPSYLTRVRAGLTGVLDQRTVRDMSSGEQDEPASHKCTTWGPALTGGTINTNDPTVKCLEGLKIGTPLTIVGSGISTVIVRNLTGAQQFIDANVANPAGGQLHILVDSSNTSDKIVLGPPGVARNIRGTYIFAPSATCLSPSATTKFSGSLACNSVDALKGTFTHVEPMFNNRIGRNSRVWTVAN